MFFNFSPTPPIVSSYAGSFLMRFLQIFWILLAVPVATFVFGYYYPSMEKKSIKTKIDFEIPFVTMHMAAVSSSMIEPSKIFQVIISTGEYPNIPREFRKIINRINIEGYDLVNALREVSRNNASSKLSELLGGMATVITTGGNLMNFFEKRSEGLLLEHRLEREKYNKYAETFMDVYISVVIAAPMILMLLLMIIKISGIGISITSAMISLIMIAGVSIVNFIFIIFLNMKEPPS